MMAEANIDFLFLLSRWLHVAAAIVALGGAAFQRIAFLPAAGASLSEPTRVELREAIRKRWARVVHVCIVILLVTGGYNFVVLALPPKIEPMPYHAIFLFKFLAALAIFFLASVLVGRGQGFAQLRGSKGSLTSILVLGAIVVLISGILSQVRSGQSGRQPPESRAAAPSE
jgi:uncharacterized membrane protein